MKSFFIKNQFFIIYFTFLFIILSLGFSIALLQDQILVLNQDLELLLKGQSNVATVIFVSIFIFTYIFICSFYI